MILKVWVIFNELDLVCMCVDHKCKDCSYGYECAPYIVKFTPIEEDIEGATKKLVDNANALSKELDKIAQISKRFLK